MHIVTVAVDPSTFPDAVLARHYRLIGDIVDVLRRDLDLEGPEDIAAAMLDEALRLRDALADEAARRHLAVRAAEAGVVEIVEDGGPAADD